MLNPGQILDKKYEIIKILGRGGMGTVYLCKNNRLGNLWAIKEVNSQCENSIDFLAESNILKNLSHIGIIRIVDIFYENDDLYIVEDYIEGMTLKEHVDGIGPLTSALVTDISLQLCSILDYLHSFNPPIVYRDLKPPNIMLKPDNKVVLIDFGIARAYKEGQEGDTMLLGSMGYIAPEQLVNVQSNAQTDIYSLGVCMFFMLTGKSTILPKELINAENYPANVPKRLVKVIQKATAIEPLNRYTDVKLMLLELNAIIADGSNEKTMFMNAQESAIEAAKTTLVAYKKPSKTTKLIIIAVLACIIAIIFSALYLNKKASDKNAAKSLTTPKTVEKTQPKKVVESDINVRGILDTVNPILLNPDPSNDNGPGKGHGKNKNKDKNKNSDLQYVLNPAAAISNSKLSISLTSIEFIGDEVIVNLSIQNTAASALELDLSKTYLVNSNNDYTNIDNPNSTNLVSIPQSPSSQELKLYFKNFDFQESTFTLKTVLISTLNKDINLYVDIK